MAGFHAPITWRFHVPTDILTGIHLMRTGEIEANLVNLNTTAGLPYIDELIERKLAGPEKGKLSDADLDFHQSEFVRLRLELEQAHELCTLPEIPRAAAGLHDLLVRVRTNGLNAS